jgi:hypothetical protein
MIEAIEASGGPIGLTQKQLHILSADASCLAALRKLGIFLIFLHFRALPGRRLNA